MFIKPQRQAAPWSQHNFWGQYDAAANLPNTATSDTQVSSAELQVGDVAWANAPESGSLYVCTDPTAGAAVWQAISYGGGSGSPTVDLLTGFTSGNQYDGASNGLGGATTGFLAAAMGEILALQSPDGQTLWSNIETSVAGWQINIEANGAFNVLAYDTAGNPVGPTAAAADMLNDPAASFLAAKHWLIILQGIDNGGNLDVGLWVNANLVDIATGINPYAPRSGPPQVGVGAFGNVAENTGIIGTAYLEGSLTDDEIRAWTFECMVAADIVDPESLGWTTYSVKRGTPGATWDPSEGAGPTLDLVGSLTQISRPIARFG